MKPGITIILSALALIFNSCNSSDLGALISDCTAMSDTSLEQVKLEVVDSITFEYPVTVEVADFDSVQNEYAAYSRTSGAVLLFNSDGQLIQEIDVTKYNESGGTVWVSLVKFIDSAQLLVVVAPNILLTFDRHNGKEIKLQKISKHQLVSTLVANSLIFQDSLKNKKYLYAYNINQGIDPRNSEFYYNNSFVAIVDITTLQVVGELLMPKTSRHYIHAQNGTSYGHYEPVFALDQVKGLLKVVYPCDNKMFVYDLSVPESPELRDTLKLDLEFQCNYRFNLSNYTCAEDACAKQIKFALKTASVVNVAVSQGEFDYVGYMGSMDTAMYSDNNLIYDERLRTGLVRRLNYISIYRQGMKVSRDVVLNGNFGYLCLNVRDRALLISKYNSNKNAYYIAKVHA